MAGVLSGGTVYYAHPGAVDPTVRPRRAFLNPLGVKDVLDGGAGSIRGQSPGLVTFDGQPGKAKVLCCEYPTMRIVRSTRSAADGTYALENLRTDKEYLIVGLDETRTDNAVVMDRIKAGP